ncbi:GGDEF-domain containing protein, partial [Pseudoalteromonas ruthenica]
MNVLALVLVLLGALGLCVSLKPAIKLCQISRRLGWRVLFILILFFVIGYVAFASYLLDKNVDNMLDLGVSLI